MAIDWNKICCIYLFAGNEAGVYIGGMGIILVMVGVMMFFDSSTGLGGIISVFIGIVLWVIGAYALNTFKKHAEDEVRVNKVRRFNTICFVVSCIILAIVMILPIIGPML